MANYTKIKIAIIGVGLIGPRHAKTVMACADTEVAAIVDPMAAGAELARELGATYFPSVEAMMQSSLTPDAAIVCTPNHTHVAITKQLATAGIHTLVEKPFCTDAESGKELLEHLSTTRTKVLVGHHRRFNPYIQAAKEIVDSGTLGRVISMNGVWATHKPLDYFEHPAEWRKGLTGGVVLINMIHEVDLLQHLFGPIVRVHAEQMLSQRGFEAEEGAVLTMRFHSGAVGSFLVADNLPSPFNFEAGTGENPLIPRTGQDFYRVFGSEASLSIPDMTIWSYETDRKSWHNQLLFNQVPVPDGVPFELQLQHFVAVIRGEDQPMCTGEAGLAAVVVCDAIRRALRENTTVDIELM